MAVVESGAALLTLAAALALLSCRGFAQTAASAPSAPEITIDPGKVACERFLGFGAEWDPQFWATFNQKMGVTEEDWQRVVRRIQWMRMPAVRMMIQTRWCYQGEGKFDWDSQEMKGLYRYLDVCQKENITVFLTDWGVATWAKAPGLRGNDDPKYAQVIGTYLEHLIQAKGYTCIKYFILVNEPNYEGGGWEAWKKGVQNVSKVIAERKLKVTMVGTDASSDSQWHRRGVDELAGAFGAWDVHRYAPQAEVKSGQFEKSLLADWDYARKKDPQIGGKFFIVGEAGMADGMVGSWANTYIDSFEYGLFMADYAIQAAQAGTSMVSAWMMDDSSHEGFTWGLWKNKANGFALRPWFCTWSLLARYVPPGSTVLKIDSPSDTLRILAVIALGKKGEKGREGWTFCLVNRAGKDVDVVFRMTDGPTLQLDHYLFTTRSMAVDENGFPRPVERQQADLSRGLPVNVPACSVVFFTSIKD